MTEKHRKTTGPCWSGSGARDLPFVCANPDIVFERGDRLIWCAGAPARDYAQLGGRVIFARKLHQAIYDVSFKVASEVLGHQAGAADALAIGDGMFTDVEGEARPGMDVLYVSGGIQAREYGETLNPDRAAPRAFLDSHERLLVATMPRLR